MVKIMTELRGHIARFCACSCSTPMNSNLRCMCSMHWWDAGMRCPAAGAHRRCGEAPRPAMAMADASVPQLASMPASTLRAPRGHAIH